MLAIHRYYWPDTPPYASLLRAIVARWRDDGHLVDVFSTQPSYRPEARVARRPPLELLDEIPVRRVRLPRGRHRLSAAVSMLGFSILAAGAALIRRRDVVMCSTSPPVILASLTSLAARARGSAFIYHCMDLHPEIGALSGDFSHPLLRRVLARLEHGTCRRSESIVVLSTDMRDSLVRRDPAIADRIVVIANTDLPGGDLPTASPAGPTRRLRVVFTGNVGRFQGLEALIDAVAEPGLREQVDLVIMGDGSLRQALMNRAERLAAPVRFLPHGSVAEARALMRTADLGAVTLMPGIIHYAYPSKTATYLSEGLPLLVAVEASSQLAREVDDRLGFVVPPGDAAAVATVLRRVLADRSLLTAMAGRARAFAERTHGTEATMTRWSVLLDPLHPGARREPAGTRR